MICSLKSCPRPHVPIDGNVDRVEIRAAVSRSLLKEKELRVSWQPDGNAVFHAPCWQSLLAVSAGKERLPRKRRRAPSDRSDALRATEARLVSEAAETAEFHDAASALASAGRRVADMIREARHCVFFTGAGISTAAGIGDYRGKDGKWTEMDRGELHGEDAAVDGDEDGVPYESLRPTVSHEVIAQLVEKGLVKFIITQNCDDLHGLSGVPSERLAELHGNVFVEHCPSCQRRYRRGGYVLDDESSEYFETPAKKRAKLKRKPHWIRCGQCSLCHTTGRRCETAACGELLIDSIINFGDDLEADVLAAAEDAAARADLVVCLGTTISVTPASLLVRDAARRRGCRLVICNRQATELDARAVVRAHGDCDPLAEAALRHLLGPADFRDWERRRSERRAEYERLRGQRTETRAE